MKRTISLILATAFVLSMAVSAMAAGEVVNGNWTMYVITITCKGDATNGSIADTAIRSDSHASGASTGIVHGGPEGWCLYKVIADPGATAPDEASVIIKDSGANDLLDGNGATLIHATLTLCTHAQIDGTAAKQPVIGTITLDVDAQATSAALYVITLIFVRP